MIENSMLLIGGLGVGIVAALVAVLPHWLAGGAAVPWLSLAATLALVLVVGWLAGLVAVRATLRAQLLPALRRE
jgi:putative ABC transport system permease protein